MQMTAYVLEIISRLTPGVKNVTEILHQLRFMMYAQILRYRILIKTQSWFLENCGCISIPPYSNWETSSVSVSPH